MFTLIKNLLYPKVCLSCHRFGSYICTTCKESLVVFNPQRCFYCKEESEAGKSHSYCRERYGVDIVLSVFYYTPILKKIITNIKYRLVKEALTELLKSVEFRELSFAINNRMEGTLIQPIPLHYRRLNLRGFNQSAIIADWFTAKYGGTTSDSLIRTKETLPQARLSKYERFFNLKDAFSLKKGFSVENKEVLLVDDVITTGNTVKDACKALKLAGASKVGVFSLARG